MILSQPNPKFLFHRIRFSGPPRNSPLLDKFVLSVSLSSMNLPRTVLLRLFWSTPIHSRFKASKFLCPQTSWALPLAADIRLFSHPPDLIRLYYANISRKNKNKREETPNRGFKISLLQLMMNLLLGFLARILSSSNKIAPNLECSSQRDCIRACMLPRLRLCGFLVCFCCVFRRLSIEKLNHLHSADCESHQLPLHSAQCFMLSESVGTT